MSIQSFKVVTASRSIIESKGQVPGSFTSDFGFYLAGQGQKKMRDGVFLGMVVIVPQEQTVYVDEKLDVNEEKLSCK